MLLEKNFEKDVASIESTLCTQKNFDLVSHPFSLIYKKACAFYIDGYVPDASLSKLFDSLRFIGDETLLKDEETFIESSIPYGDVGTEESLEGICTDILSGRCVLIIEGFAKGIVIDIRSYPQRSVSEPDKEKVLRGSKDSFVESLIFNAALIRRRIRDTNLRFEYFQIGDRSKTDVGVCYLDDKVNKKHLQILKKKLREIKVPALTMNQQTLADLLIKRPWIDPFPKFRYTERVDTATAQIFKGDIVVIIDNAPSVMLMPVTLFDIMEEANDYYFPPITGTYLRIVRYIVTLLTTFITPLWLLALKNPESVPEMFQFVLLKTEPNIPILLQLILLEIAVDGLKLASLNTPSMMTTSLSMIGGIIVGDFAVKTGWFCAESMLYMAAVALANFSLPSVEMTYALKFTRIFNLILTSLFGIYGFFGGIIITFLSMAFNRSIFGFTFLYPLIPFDGKKLLGKFVRFREKSNSK